MKKISLFFIIPFSFLVINWSKQNVNTDYCYGKVTLVDGKTEEIVDIKIGRTVSTAENIGIKVYRKPTEATKKVNFIDYMFDLKKISKIELDMQQPTAMYDDQEYTTINIYSPSNKISRLCIIPKEEKIIAKIKNTGWTVEYPFNKVKQLIISQCSDEQPIQQNIQAEETAVLNLEKSLQEIKKINTRRSKKELKELEAKTEEVLEKIKNDIKKTEENDKLQ